QERPRDSVANRARLAGRSTATHVDQGIELPHRAGELERLTDHHAERLAREVVLEGPAIDDDVASAGLEPHASDRGFAPSCSVILSHANHKEVLYEAAVPGRSRLAIGSGF